MTVSRPNFFFFKVCYFSWYAFINKNFLNQLMLTVHWFETDSWDGAADPYADWRLNWLYKCFYTLYSILVALISARLKSCGMPLCYTNEIKIEANYTYCCESRVHKSKMRSYHVHLQTLQLQYFIQHHTLSHHFQWTHTHRQGIQCL